jgi:hypothetical protein
VRLGVNVKMVCLYWLRHHIASHVDQEASAFRVAAVAHVRLARTVDQALQVAVKSVGLAPSPTPRARARAPLVDQHVPSTPFSTSHAPGCRISNVMDVGGLRLLWWCL